MFSTSTAPQNALLDDFFSSFLNNDCYTDEIMQQHDQHEPSTLTNIAFDEVQANCLSQYLEIQQNDARRAPSAPSPPRSSASSSEGSPSALNCSFDDEFLPWPSTLENGRMNNYLVQKGTSSLYRDVQPQDNGPISTLAFPHSTDAFPHQPHTPSPSPTHSSPPADDTTRTTKKTEELHTKTKRGRKKREPPHALSSANLQPLKPILPMSAPSKAVLLAGPVRNDRTMQRHSHSPPSVHVVAETPTSLEDEAFAMESISTASTIKDEPQSPPTSLPQIQINTHTIPPLQKHHLTPILPLPVPCHSEVEPKRRSPAEEKAAAAHDAMARRHERLIKNRAAAILSRKRKRDHIQLLEAQSNELKDETDLLKSRISTLESDLNESRMERDEARAERDNAKRELDALSELLRRHGETQNIPGHVITSSESSDFCVGLSAANPCFDPLSPLKSHEFEGEHRLRNERRNVRENQPKPPKSASVLLMIVFFSFAFWTLPRIDENARLAFKPPMGSSSFYSERTLNMDAGLTVCPNNSEESRGHRSLESDDEKDPAGRCTAADLAQWLKRLGTELIGYRIAVTKNIRKDQTISSPPPSPGVDRPASTCETMSCQLAVHIEAEEETHMPSDSVDVPSSSTLSCYSSSCPSKIISAKNESGGHFENPWDNPTIASASNYSQVNKTPRPYLRIDVQLLGPQNVSIRPGGPAELSMKNETGGGKRIWGEEVDGTVRMNIERQGKRWKREILRYDAKI